MNGKVRGYPRALSGDQIQQVLRWHANATRFRNRQRTFVGFAKSLKLSVHQLEHALRGEVTGLSLTVPQRKAIARWGARRRRFLARHPTARALAKSLGVSRSTVFLCISKKGSYKTAYRAPAAAFTGSGAKSASAHVHSTLLRTWRRVAADDELAPEE